MMLALTTGLIGNGAATIALGRPPEEIPADAYLQPIPEGDDAYWRYRNEGYFQEPEP